VTSPDHLPAAPESTDGGADTGSTRRSDVAVRAPRPVKIIIAGGFGVGKTTAVASISDIEPLTTESVMTTAGVGVDDTGLTPGKTTTTVAMDFGTVRIDDDVKVYLFGTPGQARFGFMWDDLVRGALGAAVIVDSPRIDDCYPAVDYAEKTGIPFIVAVNTFDGVLTHTLDEIRWALAVSPDVPVVAFDARSRRSVRDVLLVLLEHALVRATRGRPVTG
jgi:signal recognition particle receptor subunit beta